MCVRSPARSRLPETPAARASAAVNTFQRRESGRGRRRRGMRGACRGGEPVPPVIHIASADGAACLVTSSDWPSPHFPSQPSCRLRHRLPSPGPPAAASRRGLPPRSLAAASHRVPPPRTPTAVPRRGPPPRSLDADSRRVPSTRTRTAFPRRDRSSGPAVALTSPPPVSRSRGAPSPTWPPVPCSWSARRGRVSVWGRIRAPGHVSPGPCPGLRSPGLRARVSRVGSRGRASSHGASGVRVSGDRVSGDRFSRAGDRARGRDLGAPPRPGRCCAGHATKGS
jgi:hypothetical protein